MSSRVLVLSADGTAAETLKRALAASGFEVSVAHDAQMAQRVLPQQQLVIIDAPDGTATAELCRRLRGEATSTQATILAIAHSPDVEARVELLEAGADDVLAMPIDEVELSALVEALLLRSSAAMRRSALTTAADPNIESTAGRVIAFAAAKGGSGTTALAVNTAVLLAEMAPGSVAIADLDLYQGQVATHLDVYTRTSTAGLAREDQAVLTPKLLAEAGRSHASGLVVFGAPLRPDEATGIRGANLQALVTTLRGQYRTTIVDAGSNLDEHAVAVLNAADRVVMVVTPDIPALRLLHAGLQVMSDLGTLAERTIFIVNDTHARSSIGAEQIDEHLDIKVAHAIPYDGEAFLKSVNEGQPLVTFARRSAAGMAIRRLAEMVAKVTSEPFVEEPAQPRSGGLLRGLLGRNG